MVLDLIIRVLALGIPIVLLVVALSWALLRLTAEARREAVSLQNRIPLEELFISLEFILTTEINLYEQFLQNNGDTDLTTLLNSEFENIYRDLSTQCLKAPSPQFWMMAEIYMDRKSVQTYITQRVYNYLADKIQEG